MVCAYTTGKEREGGCWWPLPVSGWCLMSCSHRAGGSAVGCKLGQRAEVAIPPIPPFLWGAVGLGGLQPSPPLLLLPGYPPRPGTQPSLSPRGPLWFGRVRFGTVFCTAQCAVLSISVNPLRGGSSSAGVSPDPIPQECPLAPAPLGSKRSKLSEFPPLSLHVPVAFKERNFSCWRYLRSLPAERFSGAQK